MSKKTKVSKKVKAKENKSEIIRRHHDSGYSVKEIKAMTGYSDGLVRLVIRNLEKKREKNSAKEGKAQFKSPRSRLINDLFQVKKAMDALEKKPTKLITQPQFAQAALDLINNPPHYKVGGVDFLDYAEAKGLTENAYLFNVVKYVSRAGKKLGADPVQDLQKAEFYLKREIERRKSA